MTRRRLLIFLGILLLAALIVGAVEVILHVRAARNVHGSSTQEFVTTSAPKPKPPPVPGLVWPTYGFDAARDRDSPYRQRPPYREVWRFPGRALIEFPPVIGYGRLYVANNDGILFAVDATTGKEVWSYDSGRVQAASPALDAHLVFHTFLYRRKRAGATQDGEVVALTAATGKVRWHHVLAAPSESSPLVRDGRVYVGDWSGRVYCFSELTGRLVWTARTGGAVKSAVSTAGGRLYVGSYDHHLYSFDARTGKQLWRASVQPRFGALGRFYSSPAVAYGRVYIGGTDGRVYSYGATTGRIRWSHQTGGYVYASPAVSQNRVFAGSYDHYFYAFNAATGDVLWRFDAHGRISGSATVVAGLVYFSTLEGRTYALDVRTGAVKWSYPDGQYTPVVVDEHHLYLVGGGTVHALVSRAPARR